jgi:hypothetical protein
MTCSYCRHWVLEERAVVGPSQQPFCTPECRNAWIWYSQTCPTPEASKVLLRASRAAQATYLRTVLPK